ncbi:MAG: hypothetical protein G01um101420_915 [Parcubacteria group bacterium Gr01-1014_20]|nr:MAG: hypothetical protein G01um101420_915 [Parcubacteria group bacterium Gr01-1014_20]
MKIIKYLGLVLALVLVTLFFVKARENRLEENFRVAFESTSASNHRAVFEKSFDKLGAEKIMKILEGEYPLCHDQAHDLGRVVFGRTRDIAESIQICKDGCTGACFHGVLMEAFSSDKRQETSDKENGDGHVWLDDIKEKAAELCDSSQVLDFHSKGKCVHGVGHAFSYLSGYKIPEALQACRVFGDKRFEFYCAGGVFMEYEGARGDRDLASESLHYPCDKYGGEYPAACYPHKVPYILKELGSKESLILECLKLDGFSKTACFNGLGYQYNLGVDKNPRLIAQLCNDGSLNDQRACLYGAVIKIAEINPGRRAEICGFLEGEKREFCEDTFREGPYSLERDFSLFF